MYYYSNELYHHGVKGMKWGVRKQRFKATRQARLKNQHYTRYGKGVIKEYHEVKKLRAKHWNKTLSEVKRANGAVNKGAAIVKGYLTAPQQVWGWTGTSRASIANRYGFDNNLRAITNKKKQFTEFY